MAKTTYNDHVSVLSQKQLDDALDFCKELLTEELKKAETQCDFCDYVNILSGESYDRRDKIITCINALNGYRPW